MRRVAVRYGAAGVAGVVLAVALVLMVNWVATRQYVRGDWTRSQVYSLSPKTEGILSGLEQQIRVVVFMTPASQLYPQVSELLARYAAASDKVVVEYIDPDREPMKTRQLAEEFGISVADTVVFSYGDRTKYVTSDQMVEYDFQGMQYGQQPTIRAFKGEEQLTSAILSLVAPGVPKIYFVTGHGEASVAAAGGAMADRSLAVLEEILKRENLEVADTTLLAGHVPEDADVLAIVGPTQPYTEVEIAALGAFLDGGGRLLVCLDPLIDAGGAMRPTRLEAFLGERGVAVGDDLVVDPSRRLPFYDLSAVYLTDLGSHPVTQGLEGIAMLFTVTRSLTAEGEGSTAIVETTADGWGETDLAALLAGQPVDKGDSDTPGPVAVAVAVEQAAEPAGLDADAEAAGAGADPGWRLVAFGDSDFLADVEISNAGNAALAANAFNWLAARDESVGIPPRPVDQVNLFLTQQQLSMILLVTLVLMPGAAIVAGIVVWRRRRH